MTTCVDDALSNVTRALEDAGMWDNTVLIVSTGATGQASAAHKNTLNVFFSHLERFGGYQSTPHSLLFRTQHFEH